MEILLRTYILIIKRITRNLNMVVNNWNKQRCKIGYTDISVWLSTNHLLSKILLYLQNLDKMDKYWLKKTKLWWQYIQIIIFFLKSTLVQVGKTANKRTKKALLINNLRNVKQCTNYLTVQSYQLNINRNNFLMLKC